jgi:alcohol dehydrogenase
MAKGKIKSIVDSIYSFENAVEAHTKMLKGNLFGKILMKPT